MGIRVWACDPGLSRHWATGNGCNGRTFGVTSDAGTVPETGGRLLHSPQQGPEINISLHSPLQPEQGSIPPSPLPDRTRQSGMTMP